MSVVCAVLCKSFSAEEFAPVADWGKAWPVIVAWISAAMITWTIPFALAWGIRSPLKVGLLCTAIGFAQFAFLLFIKTSGYVSELLN